MEANAAAPWIVLRIGGTFALGRILHAVGMFGALTPLRGLGILMTHPGLLAISADVVAVNFR
ncbi:MAPEG family protein [Rhizobium azibense]|nr:MAPEG family protein [Rhizobium azibense]